MLSEVDYSGLIGIGVLIGIPLALTYFSEEKFNITVLLIYMTIVNAFLVSIGILPLWTQVLFLILIVALTVMNLQSNSKGVSIS